MGYYAVNSTSGEYNTALGFRSLFGVTNGNYSYNTALGTWSGFFIQSGNYNTFVGSYAGYNITTGGGNTLIGSGSGQSIQTGGNNTIIGKYAGTAALASTVVLSDGLGNVQLYATGSQVAIGKTATPNATLDVTGSMIVTGSLTVTGNIIGLSTYNFVSCSLSVVGATTASRAFVAEFKDVDGSPLTRPQQLIHWWTSATETGSAVSASGNTYTVVSGSNIVPISNSGSINHAVTAADSKFAVRCNNAGSTGTATVWFNTEVQGIIYSISTTLGTGGGG